MYKIGEFSTMTGISKRMLRYYEEKGLIVPTRDKNSSYRYYSVEDLLVAKHIKTLSQYGLSVDGMMAVIQAKDSAPYLEAHRQSLEKNLDAIESTVESMLGQETVFSTNQTYDIGLKTFADKWGLAFELKSWEDIDVGIQTMYKTASLLGLQLVERPFVKIETQMTLYHPIIKPVQTLTEVQFLPSEKYLTALHYGTYITIEKAYDAIVHYAKERGMTLGDTHLERYLVDGQHTSLERWFVTEVGIEITS